MTVHQDVTISCDGPDCDAVYVDEDSTRAEAERRAETADWHLPDSGEDRCPQCAALADPS